MYVCMYVCMYVWMYLSLSICLYLSIYLYYIMYLCCCVERHPTREQSPTDRAWEQYPSQSPHTRSCRNHHTDSHLGPWAQACPPEPPHELGAPQLVSAYLSAYAPHAPKDAEEETLTRHGSMSRRASGGWTCFASMFNVMQSYYYQRTQDTGGACYPSTPSYAAPHNLLLVAFLPGSSRQNGNFICSMKSPIPCTIRLDYKSVLD